MSVKINYKGRCGNNIFQYVTARIFAEKNNLNLSNTLNCDILKINQNNNFSNQPTNRTVFLRNNNFVNDDLPFYGIDVEYILDDFFQNCVYINKHKDLVKNFFKLPEVKKNNRDIVLSIRLDDKVHSNNRSNPETWDNAEIVHPDYYKKILETETYEKIYIVVDKLKYDWEYKYMSNFINYNPIIINGTSHDDFHFIRSFNKIVTSTSTYSYWAAFLSEAEKIYTFKNAGFLGNPMRSHGNHVKELWNIKNQSIVIDEKFYFGE